MSRCSNGLRGRTSRPRRNGLPRFIEQVEDRCLLATFMVTSTNDSGPGSLRAAIAQVNNDTSDVAPSSPDLIEFALTSNDPNHDTVNGVWTITPTTALDPI